MTKVLLLVGLYSCFICSAFSKVIEKKNLKFNVIGSDLVKGDIHFSFSLMEPKTFKKKYRQIKDLDSLEVRKEPNVKIMLTKAAFIVKTPIGFFDHEHMKNLTFIKYIHEGEEVSEVSDSQFNIRVPGEHPYSYTLKTYFDSDDISSLPTSKAVRAMTAAKKIDVITQSSNSMVFSEMSNFTTFALGGSSVTTYMSLKENSTLILHYELIGIRTSFADRKVLRQEYQRHIQQLQKAINSYPR